ncbi:hypothetical protein FVE85_9728 [Porphyridium purpureum]|uniref:CCHC-type domain-containing protein n=1 Tax=Porphyridium purpureum TaxID=35688 RepID=A0A5J4YJQ7_PORPP|nr:hypothetical protein FVE85_9728 [Porphyridium purpureum]|eukprot:POR9160..scf246_12
MKDGKQRGAPGRSAHVRDHGLVNALPVLEYDGVHVAPAAVVLWLEVVGEYARKEYGDLAMIFTLDGAVRRYPVPQPIPALTEEQAASFGTESLEAFVLKEELKVRLAAREREEGDIRGPQGAVLRLHTRAVRVLATHLTRGYDDNTRNQQYARHAYETLRVGHDESLLSFKVRFKAALLAMEAVGELVPTTQRRAADFMSRLEGTRWDEAARKCLNEARTFASVDEVVSYVAQYGYARQPLIGRTWAAVTGEPREEAATRLDDRTCYNCGGDHLMRDCDERPRDEQMAVKIGKAKRAKERYGKHATRISHERMREGEHLPGLVEQIERENMQPRA